MARTVVQGSISSAWRIAGLRRRSSTGRAGMAQRPSMLLESIPALPLFPGCAAAASHFSFAPLLVSRCGCQVLPPLLLALLLRSLCTSLPFYSCTLHSSHSLLCLYPAAVASVCAEFCFPSPPYSLLIFVFVSWGYPLTVSSVGRPWLIRRIMLLLNPLFLLYASRE
jgi:hypothetical protein